MIYTVTLNPTLDYTLRVKHLDFNDVNRAYADDFLIGGKGINVSVMLRRLGVDTVAFIFTAGFSGEKFKEILRDSDGVNCEYIDLKNGNTRINVKIRCEYDLDVNVAGPEPDDGEIAALLEKIDRIGAGDTLVLSGSVCKNMPSDFYRSVIERLDGRGVRFVVDATGDTLLETLRYRPFLIKPNHHELGGLFGVETETDEDVVKYATRLREMGAQNVLVSRAEKGAVLVGEDGKVRILPAVKGEQVNSVGAGDSVVAGFLAGYERSGGDLDHALRLGAACGTATAFTDWLATKDQVEEILKNYPSGTRSSGLSPRD